MVTRRRFISITLMILALFVLFQGPQFIRERYNDYGVNAYYKENKLNINDIWDNAAGAKDEIILVSSSKDLTAFVDEWANYSKKRLVITDTIDSALANITDSTKLIVVSQEEWMNERMEYTAETILNEGVSILFAKLPDASRLNASKKAMTLVGIDSITQEQVTVDGIRLFEGFFLGGERIFKPVDEDEEKRQDLDLIMPWYRTGAGTETFMMGIFEDDTYQEKELENEEFPPVIWSCGHEHAKTFSVSGDYMDDRMISMGILSAVMANISEAEVYPIVNSQQLQIINFPSLADENSEEMARLYSRSQTQFQKNIVYPGIVADTDGNGFNLTSYIMPQYDYADDKKPNQDELLWYLSQLNEKKAEMGYSLVHNSDTDMSLKLASDMELLDKEAPKYQFSAIYAQTDDAEAVLDILPERLKQSVHTVCTENLMSRGIIDYLSDDVTVQQSTATVNAYSYFNDLQTIGAETALGYASIAIDMERVLWPETEDDQWQNASKTIFSVVDTYWKNFSVFSKTTASQTDQNIRNMLSLSYDYDVEGNTIVLTADHFADQASFIIRLHNKKVTNVSNGSFERIEQDAYLVTITDHQCEISLDTDIDMNR